MNNIEELKLILSMLEKLGSAGSDLFLWWLFADKILPAMVGLFAISGLFTLFLIILKKG